MVTTINILTIHHYMQLQNFLPMERNVKIPLSSGTSSYLFLSLLLLRNFLNLSLNLEFIYIVYNFVCLFYLSLGHIWPCSGLILALTQG